MRKYVFFAAYILGAGPMLLASFPAVILLIFFDGWGGYAISQKHIPFVWWHDYTSRNATYKNKSGGK